MGAWSQYKAAKVGDLVILDDSQDLSKAANAMINPMTAVGLCDIAKGKKATAVIQTAASSSLSKQVNRYFQKEGIKVINIVRRDE